MTNEEIVARCFRASANIFIDNIAPRVTRMSRQEINAEMFGVITGAISIMVARGAKPVAIRSVIASILDDLEEISS